MLLGGGHRDPVGQPSQMSGQPWRELRQHVAASRLRVGVGCRVAVRLPGTAARTAASSA